MPSEDSLANMNFKLVVFYGLISYVSAIEPVSAFGAIGTAFVAGLYTAYTPIKCHFNECCTSKWINLNTTGSLIFLFTDEIVYKVKDNFFHFYKSDDLFYENCTSYGTWFLRPISLSAWIICSKSFRPIVEYLVYVIHSVHSWCFCQFLSIIHKTV